MRALLLGALLMLSPAAFAAGTWDDLVALHAEFRAFERPPLRDGVPDYTAATTARRHAELPRFRARLDVLPYLEWPLAQQVDWHLVRAMLNGFDFDVRVLQPWVRDPAWYQSVWTAQSDTPAHEGPTLHSAIELWRYAFPLSRADEAKLAGELRGIPPLLAQARGNLTGNARDLWVAGTGTLRQQVADLDELATRVPKAGRELRAAIRDERALLERELARAWSSLALEEARNRGLPPMPEIASKAEYDARALAASDRLLAFLRERDVMTVEPWFEPQMRAHLLDFVPAEKRNFFAIVTHHEPLVLFLHWYHWWDHGRMAARPHPSPIRREALPFNIWMSRAEGMSTANEEMLMHAGLFDAQPRARELVWIMLAARAARGLASLHAQANEFTMKQASDFHVEWTPRGWMKRDDLLGTEQQLYLRQPGYGTSYVTGKVLIEELMQARMKQLGPAFSTRRFFAELDAAGLIPVPLIRLELAGEGCCATGTPNPAALTEN